MTSLAGDLRVLRKLLFHRSRGETHQDRLESFYGDQAGDYDGFRERLLHGRSELMRQIQFPPGGHWVDLGCGTGHNVTLAKERCQALGSIDLVDLSPSLLSAAKQQLGNTTNLDIRFHVEDATKFGDAETADVVTFSYSLTMIPDWFAAIENAYRILRPGGVLGVTDFYVSRKHEEMGLTQHGFLSRVFWANWFAGDNVFLSGDHLAMLRHKFRTIELEQECGPVPYMPLLRAPYYVWLGRK